MRAGWGLGSGWAGLAGTRLLAWDSQRQLPWLRGWDIQRPCMGRATGHRPVLFLFIWLHPGAFQSQLHQRDLLIIPGRNLESRCEPGAWL